MSLLNYLATLKEISLISSKSKEKLKETSKEMIQIFLDREKLFYDANPAQFRRGKLLQKVVDKETTFSDELKDLGKTNFLNYGNNYNTDLVWDKFGDAENLVYRTKFLDTLIRDLYG